MNNLNMKYQVWNDYHTEDKLWNEFLYQTQNGYLTKTEINLSLNTFFQKLEGLLDEQDVIITIFIKYKSGYMRLLLNNYDFKMLQFQLLESVITNQWTLKAGKYKSGRIDEILILYKIVK